MTNVDVLYLTFWYPATDKPYTGVFIKEHAKAIRESNVNILVLHISVLPGDSFFKKRTIILDDQGLKTIRLEISSRFYKMIYIAMPFLYRLVVDCLEKEVLPGFKPQIIHSNVINPAGVIGYWISRYYGWPHIISEHWSKVDKFMNTSIFSRVARKAYQTADSVTVVSEFLGGTVRKYVIQPQQVHIVGNVIDTEVFSYAPKATREILQFTAVATWKYPKLPYLFMMGLERLHQAGVKFRLSVVGEGPELQKLKEHSWSYEVSYPGFRSKMEIATLLHATDYFLHASATETFSVVVAEALATGTPVIASDTGALSELVNNNNGILAHNTIEDWEKALNSVVLKQFDHRRISQEMARFSKKEIGSTFGKLYNLTLSNRIKNIR